MVCLPFSILIQTSVDFLKFYTKVWWFYVIFTNEVLEEIKTKKDYNITYSKYYYRLSQEYKKFNLPVRSKRIFHKSERIKDCMNLWLWDIYHKNKIMDLQKVNRCMDSRFCPNCKKFNLASAIHNLRPAFSQLFYDGYYPYLMTLTIPNVVGDNLRDTIDKLNKSFRKFFRLLSDNNREGFKDRFLTFDAALKVLEITVNSRDNTYHPHFHVMIFSKEYDETLFDKKYDGPYQRKSKSFIKYSDMDIQIMKLWKMCFDGISITKNNYNNLSDDWFDLYQCDIKEMNEKGIYEVLKYTFKDTDIKNYDNFKNIFIALEGKRIRQGYGLLYNIKVEEEADGEKLELELLEKENPEHLLTREINQLITTYHDYKKISRFKNYSEFINLD